jgi:hypothetical protein
MIVKCHCCEKEFDKPTNKVNEAIKNNKNVYCSKDCSSKGRSNKVKVNCAHCGKELEKLPSEIKKSKTGNMFCDRSCACSFNNTEFRSGENNPNWKDGSYKSTAYAKKAFRYYKHECAICKFDEKSCLEVHHIDEDKSNDDIDNLIILCSNHHHMIHYGSLKISDDVKILREVNSL